MWICIEVALFKSSCWQVKMACQWAQISKLSFMICYVMQCFNAIQCIEDCKEFSNYIYSHIK